MKQIFDETEIAPNTWHVAPNIDWIVVIGPKIENENAYMCFPMVTSTKHGKDSFTIVPRETNRIKLALSSKHTTPECFNPELLEIIKTIETFEQFYVFIKIYTYDGNNPFYSPKFQ